MMARIHGRARGCRRRFPGPAFFHGWPDGSRRRRARNIQRFPADNAPVFARAVRVDDVPLAHTNIMLG
ncbi:MAG: hypothetical protein ACREH8_08615 [Opitutaceae bacterium]